MNIKLCLLKLYIFWFLHQTTTTKYVPLKYLSCISFDSYIKPQLKWEKASSNVVVYLLIPTSNHNSAPSTAKLLKLYIFWFLHQTTTFVYFWFDPWCCISFDSYIKPQPCFGAEQKSSVVYLLIPTSNHNNVHQRHIQHLLYIFWFLHQTTTVLRVCLSLISCISFDSYIKPQLQQLRRSLPYRCISFDSYIKPQRYF